MSAAESVVNHIADLHDASRIRSVFTVETDTKHNVIVFELASTEDVDHRWVVGGGNAIARYVGLSVGSRIDGYAAPTHMSPIYRTGHEQPFSLRPYESVDAAFYCKIVGWCRDIPSNELVGNRVPRACFFELDFE
jgi:hypothetical protein